MQGKSKEDFAVRHLAKVYAGRQDEIIGEWRLHAEELLRDLHLDRLAITDHLPGIITEIIRDLELEREGLLSAEHTQSGSPPVHGVQRFHEGLDVGEVVAEYNLLRTAFITVAERHNHYIVGKAARIINHRIDEAVRMAVMSFAAQQALIRKEQQEGHLAVVAHDLRTPLNAISLSVDLLKANRDQSKLASTDQIFAILRRNLESVESLIDRVLETNTRPLGEGSSFRPERRMFELWPLVQRLILNLGSLSSARAIEVVNEIPAPLTVFADAGLLSQVFQNLLDNAFKYAPRGRVIVQARQDADGTTCMVSDNGAGIPPNMLSQVFDRMAADPEKEGSGLGLAIVKQIVEGHGGKVKVESIPGSGATFTFSLPNQT